MSVRMSVDMFIGVNVLEYVYTCVSVYECTHL